MGEYEDLKKVKSMAEDKRDCEIHFDFWSLWLLCGACQMTVTHPALGEPLRKQYRDLGITLQGYILEYHPEVGELLKAGWYRHNDVREPYHTLAPKRELPVSPMSKKRRNRGKPR